MIVGIGIDLCSVERFAAMMERRPGILERLFSAEEGIAHGLPRTPESLAGRFAAKEALAKSLGAPAGLSWLDAEVIPDAGGRPGLVVHGSVSARAAQLGVDRFHLSLSHDAGAAIAFVVAERD